MRPYEEKFELEHRGWSPYEEGLSSDSFSEELELESLQCDGGVSGTHEKSKLNGW